MARRFGEVGAFGEGPDALRRFAERWAHARRDRWRWRGESSGRGASGSGRRVEQLALTPRAVRRGWLPSIEHCSRCGGSMRWVEAATTPEAISRLLAKHGLGPRPPPPSRSHAIAEGQLSFQFARSPR